MPRNPEPQRAANKRYRDKNRDNPKFKAARLEAQRKYYRTDRYKEKNKERQYLRKYGVTRAVRDALLAGQGGRCAICHNPVDFKNGTLGAALDHCHNTGRLRGVLCRGCNTALGSMKDSPDRLRAAALYLERT